MTQHHPHQVVNAGPSRVYSPPPSSPAPRHAAAPPAGELAETERATIASILGATGTSPLALKTAALAIRTGGAHRDLEARTGIPRSVLAALSVDPLATVKSTTKIVKEHLGGEVWRRSFAVEGSERAAIMLNAINARRLEDEGDDDEPGGPKDERGGCRHCGTQNAEAARFCKSCGKPQAHTAAPVQPQPKPADPFQWEHAASKPDSLAAAMADPIVRAAAERSGHDLETFASAWIKAAAPPQAAPSIGGNPAPANHRPASSGRHLSIEDAKRDPSVLRMFRNPSNTYSLDAIAAAWLKANEQQGAA